METTISGRIINSYFEKLTDSLELDAAIVGAGPSGLIAAWDLARAGRKVAIFERTLKPGGGIWGGAMLFNEIVVQEDAVHILEEAGIRDSTLIYQVVHAGARVFNGVMVEDVMFKDDRVAGVVVNWAPVLEHKWHVDPLMMSARAVLDAGGHDAELSARIARKAGVRLETLTGSVMGERPMWAVEGERATVENTGRIFPGLYVSGMAANGVHGAFRMGPIFGGMLLSGRKVAARILEDLK